MDLNEWMLPDGHRGLDELGLVFETKSGRWVLVEAKDDARRAWVREWRKKNGGHSAGGSRGHALKLLEEIVELCYAAGASLGDVSVIVEDETRKSKSRREYGLTSSERVGEECADVALCLDVVLIESGIDLAAEVAKKIPVLEACEWAPDADGVLRRPR